MIAEDYNENYITGWVKSYRSIMNKAWYKKSEYFHLWHHILYLAGHKKVEGWFKGESKKLQPGEFLTGRDKLSSETGIDRNKVDRILKTFESEQQIEQQISNKGRLIRIVNWDLYQIQKTSEQQSEQQVSNNRATSEQQVSTNKNVKKEKNEKNVRKNIQEKDFLSVKEYQEVVDHIASLTQRDMKITKARKEMINARVKEGYLIGDIKGVITYMNRKWSHDPKYSQYITLETILRPTNFPKYYEEMTQKKPKISPSDFGLPAPIHIGR